jgi:cell division inhibitor SepF
MGLYDKIKNKVFPDEKEVLYYSDNKEKTSKKEEETTNPKGSFFAPTSFSQTRILADKLKAGISVVIDVTNMDKKDALRMIDFLGGVMYSLNGDMKKLNKNIFEFTVPNENK